MASLAAGIVDPTKAGKYRVVLSDALLGKDAKELYTGIRYNHKPSLSSAAAPYQARLKATGSADASTSYDLSFHDDGGRYSYQGSRGHEEGQYALIFDPEQEVFVLHRIDSMFNMNLVSTPTNPDADDLRQEHPQLEPHRPAKASKSTSRAAASKPLKSKKPAAKDAKPLGAKKAEPPKPAQPRKTHRDSEDESSDGDLLTIEDPGGVAPASNRDFSPGFIDKPRRFSEFVQQQNEEDDQQDEDEEELEIEVDPLNDADGEDEGEDEEEEEEEEERRYDDDDDDDESDNFKLPSPIRQIMGQSIHASGGHHNLDTVTQNASVEQISDEDDDDNMEDVEGGGVSVGQEDMAVDLEALLMAELEAGESDVSEEE
ncbi:RNA polymerase II transcription elongation factor-domain-containing protein [Nemania sp. FL0916]|nr:RNA polymerase II transcription elongation factor-domain-containing protein [Nemania sp. FL0916]